MFPLCTGICWRRDEAKSYIFMHTYTHVCTHMYTHTGSPSCRAVRW